MIRPRYRRALLVLAAAGVVAGATYTSVTHQDTREATLETSIAAVEPAQPNFVEPPATRFMLFGERLRRVPGAADWPSHWVAAFANDVCEALDTWGPRAPEQVVQALVEQWNWSTKDARAAIDAAALYSCPQHSIRIWLIASDM